MIRLLTKIGEAPKNAIVFDLGFELEKKLVAKNVATFDLTGGFIFENSSFSQSTSDFEKAVLLNYFSSEYHVPNAGYQIKANWPDGVITTGPGLVANEPFIFNLSLISPVLSPGPTTEGLGIESAIVEPNTGALLEAGSAENNDGKGQTNIFRVSWSYQGKASNANPSVAIGIANLDNPGSSFILASSYTLPSSTTQTPTYNFPSLGISRKAEEISSFVTIADGLSIGSGYRLFAVSNVTDNNLQVTINAVTRFSFSEVDSWR